MSKSGVGSRVLATMIALGTFAIVGAGCATAPDTGGWPDLEIPSQVPADEVSEPTLLRGSDGQMYLLGAQELSPQVGDYLVGRFGTEWPLESEPPLLLASHVVEIKANYARLQVLYEVPDLDYEDLSFEVYGDSVPSVGKGITTIETVDFSGPTELTINVGRGRGVQNGDFYAILRDPQSNRARDHQLTRRLLGICMVVSRESNSSTCRLWQGHSDYQWSGTIEAGQQALFLEPTFARAPRRGLIVVNRLDDEELQSRVEGALQSYLERFPHGEVELRVVDEDVDARELEFYRWSSRLHFDEPAIFLGISVEDRNGTPHLYANYTGLGPAIGPGMVAAPPERGVDMGPLSRFEEAHWAGVSALLMGALLVYRGENSLALQHFNDLLRSRDLQGKWRWHVRDQYLMRWAALERYDEAFWLVLEDERLAEQRRDEQAYLNALGSRVRLHDLVDQTAEAEASAREYLDRRSDDRPNASYLSALAMFSEMAMRAGSSQEARSAAEELIGLCPDGCQGDLIPLLAGVFWGSFESEDEGEFKREILRRMVDVGRGDSRAMAGARMLQGWHFLSEGDLEQSMVAFLESQRLYENHNLSYGVARAQFYLALVQIGRDENQNAYERGMQALAYMEEVGDYRTRARILERLAGIYFDLSQITRRDTYIGSAPQIFGEGVNAQLGLGNLGKAAETSFGFGRFLFQVQQLTQARAQLAQGVILGLQVGRLDTVALCHLFLAVIARQEGDMTTFEAEVYRARLIAEAHGDPVIDELIDSILSPTQEREDPTQLL